MLTATLPLPFHDFNTEYYPVCVACTVECLRMSTVECLLFDMIICFGQFKFRKIYWSCQFLCGPCLFENPAVWNLNLLDTPVALPQAILLLLCLCSWCVDRVISWSVDNLHPLSPAAFAWAASVCLQNRPCVRGAPQLPGLQIHSVWPWLWGEQTHH